MTAYPQAFDEDKYPINKLSQQQKAVIAYAREQGGQITTRDLMERFGWSRRKAHAILYRLRMRGVFHSQLMWSTTKNGSNAYQMDDNGNKRFFSWLICILQPMAEWGKEPDITWSNFDPVNPQRVDTRD